MRNYPYHMARITIRVFLLAGSLTLVTTVSASAQPTNNAATNNADSSARTPLTTNQKEKTESSTEEGLTPDELASQPLTGQYGSEVDRQWQEFLDRLGLHEGGGNPGQVIVASGKAIVNFDKGHSGWMEARRTAFQVANLRARSEMVKMISQTVESSANVHLLDNPQFGQGYSAEVDKLGQAQRILKKSVDLTEATLDKALSQLDSDYNPDQYNDTQEKRTVLEQKFQQHISRAAARALTGVMTLKIIEGPSASGNQHEIRVGVVWSPKLARLATTIEDTEKGLPLPEAKGLIKDQLPQTVGQAVASFGVHSIIDKNGRLALLAFGQAEPADVGPAQHDRAMNMALDRAESFADAALAAFVGQRVTFSNTVDAKSLQRTYAGLGQSGSSISSKNVTDISSATRPVKLVGIQTPWRQVIKHPETHQEVAVVARLWSAAGQTAAKQMDRTMNKAGQGQSQKLTEPEENNKNRTAEQQITIESQDVNPNAF